MIDWPNLAANSLWILGCAIALAVFSYASWEASLQRVRLRKVLQGAGFQAAFNASGLMFSLGLAGLSTRWWETVLWLACATWFAIQLARPLIFSKRRT